MHFTTVLLHGPLQSVHLTTLLAAARRVAAERGVQELLAMPPLQELREKRVEVEWGVALCGLTILRYLTDHMGTLPLGLLSRLAGGHDTLMALVPLADRPPWVRMRRGKVRGAGGRHGSVAAASSACLAGPCDVAGVSARGGGCWLWEGAAGAAIRLPSQLHGARC